MGLFNSMYKFFKPLFLLITTAIALSSCDPQPHASQENTSTSSSKTSALLGDESNKISNTAPSLIWKTYDDSKAQAFITFCQTSYNETSELFKVVTSESLDDGQLLNTLNEIDRLLNGALARASLYANVHPSQSYRSAAEECDQKFTNLVSDISLSTDLYEQVKKVDLEHLSDIDKRYADNLLKDFKRSGVNKDQATRQKIKQLNSEINDLGLAFYKNTREDVRTLEISDVSELNGLPKDYIDARKNQETGIVTISTNYPDYYPIMQYAESDNLRRKLYVQFRQRGYPKNKPVLNDLLTKRHELATTLGYKNYADFITETQMIKAPEKAQSFIDDISRIAAHQASIEYAQLLSELKTENPDATVVNDWQKTYLQEKIKMSQYSVDAQEVREYFQYDHVKNGIFQLVSKMFDIEIKPWKTEVWHETVEAFEMSENGEVIGRFYLDMHPRDGKYKHAAAFTVQDGIKGKQIPIKALVCNFPSGKNAMEHLQVETFLHEFGHLLHGIFGGQPKWINMAGTQTERDFVEAPSQMLEEWVWDRESLQLLSSNAQGETIPDELITKLNDARHFGKGLFTTQQMFYAAVSLNYYNRAPSSFNETDLLIDLQNKYASFNYVDDTYFQYSFGHLVGYSAVYYGYMWSLVIAEDMFSEFQKGGLMNKKIAKRYREHVLDVGGTKDATEMVEGFLGRPYAFEAFSNKFTQER